MSLVNLHEGQKWYCCRTWKGRSRFATRSLLIDSFARAIVKPVTVGHCFHRLVTLAPTSRMRGATTMPGVLPPVTWLTSNLLKCDNQCLIAKIHRGAERQPSRDLPASDTAGLVPETMSHLSGQDTKYVSIVRSWWRKHLKEIQTHETEQDSMWTALQL